ncbi:hypothetical protein ACFQZC_07500 [Streptacidiphilus monticola]
MSTSIAAGPTAKRGSTPLILALGLAAMVVSMAQTQVVPILSCSAPSSTPAPPASAG